MKAATENMGPVVMGALATLKPFMPIIQMIVLKTSLQGEEGGYFAGMLVDLAARVANMPMTYQQDGLGLDAVAHLHYFSAGADWHITEKDIGAPGDHMEQRQAYGQADLGHGPECGYISIVELIRCRGVELDLYWTPKTLAEVRGAA